MALEVHAKEIEAQRALICLGRLEHTRPEVDSLFQTPTSSQERLDR
jgi:hypothetical protein